MSFEVNNFMNLLHVNATQVYTMGMAYKSNVSHQQYLLLVSLWKEFPVGCCPLTLMQSEHEVCIAHKVEIILQTVENL